MSRHFLIGARVWIGAVAAFAGGCAGTVPSPTTPLEGYARAIEARDARAAYAYFSPEIQTRVSLSRFEALFQENQAELDAQAAAIRIAMRGGVPARAYARTHTGDEIGLVFEDGAWRIDSGMLQEISARTPTDAALALRRALGRRDFETALALLSARRREAVEGWILGFLETTDDPSALEVLSQGDRATLRTSSGRAITLVREDGAWRIVDLD